MHATMIHLYSVTSLFFPLYLRGFGTSSSSSFLCLLAADWPMGDDLAARGKLGFSIRVM
jgi:hypothetical protein